MQWKLVEKIIRNIKKKIKSIDACEVQFFKFVIMKILGQRK